MDALYENWISIWESFLGIVEPHLPEYLHWNELCWTFVIYLNEVRLWIHNKTRGMENWEIVTNTIMLCFLAYVVLVISWKIVGFVFFNEDGFFNVISKIFFKISRRMPYIGSKIQNSVDKAVKDMENIFPINGVDYIQKLPANGSSKGKIKEIISTYKAIGDDKSSLIDQGYMSGATYAGDKDLYDLMVDVYKEFSYSNPLHADMYPDIRKMEAEVVRMSLNLFNGDDECCGTMTSGGTESILMACKCYRDIAFERGIKKPEIVAPLSVHPAFDKACHYFGMKLKHVPVDKATGKANVKAMKRAITKNTILLVGSVPGFPHGCIDPITELAKLAKQYNLYLHSDCCLGGFLVPFMKKAGFYVPSYDFSVPGVTSISADTHKYGFSPKGSSVIMYRSKEIRKYQYYAQTNWSGGIYTCATMPGSRPGHIVACTWAAMMYFGENGYIETTKSVITTARSIATKLEKIPGIKLMAPVDVSVVAFTSDIFDIFLLSDELSKRKWHLSPLQFPSGLHIAVTMLHTKPGVADRLINDITDISKTLMKDPSQKAVGQGAIYGMSQQIPDRSIISEICTGFLDTYYSCTAGVKK